MARDDTTSPLRPVSATEPRPGDRSARSGVRRKPAPPPDPETDSGDDAPLPRSHEASDLMKVYAGAAADSAERKAIEAVMQALLNATKPATPPPPPTSPPPLLTPEAVNRWGAVIVAAFALVAPIVQQLAGLAVDIFRPNQVVLDQLAEIRAAQDDQATKADDDRELMRDSIAWTIDAFDATSKGQPLPPVPASLNLAAAIHEAERQ